MKTLKSLTIAGLLSLVLIFSGSASAENAPILDQPASFGTTESDLGEYIFENLDYPKSLVDEEYEVKVEITFWVDKFGHVLNAEVGSSNEVGGKDNQITPVEMSLFETAALDVVQGMPKWTPAIVHGESQPVQYKLPILFKTQ